MSDNTESQARAQVESIVTMVAALDVNYERLKELREERDEWAQNMVDCVPGLLPKEEAFPKWAAENAKDAKELAELEEAAGDCTSEDDAIEDIQDDPLSIEVRSGWMSPSAENDKLDPEEFRIVLCTGGPHVELQGDLDRGTPSRVRVLYRDWGTSGEYFPNSEEREALETYCAQFYFCE